MKMGHGRTFCRYNRPHAELNERARAFWERVLGIEPSFTRSKARGFSVDDSPMKKARRLDGP